MNSTPAQLKALSLHRHLAIVANAGSGKTHVLVNRYVQILLKDPTVSPRNILAMTFTDAAGNELRTRIAAEISNRISSCPANDVSLRTKLIAIRDSISSAYISTIHSFASRIIRAYPIEAQVDAAFTVLLGPEQKILLKETIDRAFYSELESAYESDKPSPILDLFRTFGRKSLTLLMSEMLGSRFRTRELEDFLSQDDSVILKYWLAQFEALFSELRSDWFAEAISDLRSCTTSTPTGKKCAAAIDAYRPTSDLFAQIHQVRTLIPSLITTKMELRKKEFDLRVLSIQQLERVDRLVKVLNNLTPFFEYFPDSTTLFDFIHLSYLSVLRTILKLYHSVEEEYVETKTSYGLLDFDDQIAKLLSLLNLPQVREELSQQFRYVMIDEYQDTDSNQYAIAHALSERFAASCNVVIVGDPKQSIYGFRQADLSIFYQTCSEIAKQTLSESALIESATLHLTPNEEYGELILQENFRMAPTPLAFVNHVFNSILNQEEQDDPTASLPYSELVEGRTAPLPGSVEWIAPYDTKKSTRSNAHDDSDDSDSAVDADLAGECQLIARKIAQIVRDTSSAYLVEDESVLRKAEYRDIAILMRSRTRSIALEDALRAEGIPYRVAKGAGFYDQQEILDIASYLKFLAVPSDDISLAAILRSPFFAFSEVDLFKIARYYSVWHSRTDPNVATFWDKLKHYATDFPQPHLLRAVHQIENNLTLVGRTGSALLVERIIAETGLYATLAASPNGAQKIANLDKFLSIARNTDSSGFSSLFDFIDTIDYYIENSEAETQAELGSSGNAVWISTIHSAKGLEFRIVIVAFLGQKFNLSNPIVLDPKLGIHMSFPEHVTKPSIVELIKHRATVRSREEEKRILYVALTRAKDHLILSSTLPMKPDGSVAVAKNSPLALLADVIPAIYTPGQQAISLSRAIDRFSSETQTRTRVDYGFEIPVLRSLSDIRLSMSELKPEPTVEFGNSYLAPIPILHPKDRFSATQFLTMRQCPTKYHLSYVLGIPEEPKLAYDMEADVLSEKVQGKLLGQIVHALFDKLDRIAPHRIFNPDRFDRELESIFFSLGIWDSSDQQTYRRESHRHFSSFLNSDFAAEVFRGTETRTEYTTQAQIESGDILFGIIDRLYRSDDGIWTILDYKTDSAGPENHNRADKSDRYRFQMEFYAYLLKLHFDDASTVRTVLFYTSTGTAIVQEFGPQDFTGLVAECTELINQVRLNDRVPALDLLPRNLEHCSQCNFFDTARKRCVVLTADSLEPDRETRKVPELA